MPKLTNILFSQLQIVILARLIQLIGRKIVDTSVLLMVLMKHIISMLKRKNTMLMDLRLLEIFSGLATPYFMDQTEKVFNLQVKI